MGGDYFFFCSSLCLSVSQRKKWKLSKERRRENYKCPLLPNQQITKTLEHVFFFVYSLLLPRTVSRANLYPTSQPPMVVRKNGSSVGIRTRCLHVFACLVQICTLSRCLSTKFLRRSSVGSLLRVSCWLGCCCCCCLS